MDLTNEFHPVPKVFREKKSPKPINRIGKKGRANLAATAELKEKAETTGRTRCEIRLEGCWGLIQGFAHGKKKRKLTPTELRKFAIGGCNPCHDKIEYDCKKWTGLTMEQFVRKVIRERKNL